MLSLPLSWCLIPSRAGSMKNDRWQRNWSWILRFSRFLSLASGRFAGCCCRCVCICNCFFPAPLSPPSLLCCSHFDLPDCARFRHFDTNHSWPGQQSAPSVLGTLNDPSLLEFMLPLLFPFLPPPSPFQSQSYEHYTMRPTTGEIKRAQPCTGLYSNGQSAQ